MLQASKCCEKEEKKISSTIQSGRTRRSAKTRQLKKQSSSSKPVCVSIKNPEQWKTMLQNNSSTHFIVAKFTADWCKPCKFIDPFFSNTLANKYDATFVKLIRQCIRKKGINKFTSSLTKVA